MVSGIPDQWSVRFEMRRDMLQLIDDFAPWDRIEPLIRDPRASEDRPDTAGDFMDRDDAFITEWAFDDIRPSARPTER